MRRLVVGLVAVTLLAVGSTAVVADEVNVAVTPDIIEFLAGYGVTPGLMATPRTQLSGAERSLVAAVLSEEAQAELNGLVLGALSRAVAADDATVATMVVGTLKWSLGAL